MQTIFSCKKLFPCFGKPALKRHQETAPLPRTVEDTLSSKHAQITAMATGYYGGKKDMWGKCLLCQQLCGFHFILLVDV